MSGIRPFKKSYPQIAESAWIDDSAVVIGDVIIGNDSSVWPMTVIRGDVNTVVIGARSNIQDGSVLHVTHAGKHYAGAALSIGDDVTVGHKVILHACTIGDRCLIGNRSLESMRRALEGGAQAAVPRRLANSGLPALDTVRTLSGIERAEAQILAGETGAMVPEPPPYAAMLVSPEAAVETQTFGTPTGRALRPAEMMVEPPVPPMPMIPSILPSS